MRFTSHRFGKPVLIVFFVAGALKVAAQTPAPPGRGANVAGAAATSRGVDVTASRNIDKQAAQRGKSEFVTLCASCHGEDARGGAGKPGSDLIRSVMVLDDVGGQKLGEFLKYGRPEKNMPKFDLTEAQVSDIAAFLHQNIAIASERGAYQYLDVLVGNAAAGEAYFNEAGGCKSCHSVTGDLKGIGSRLDPPTLQLNIVTGGGPGGRGGRGGRGGNSATAKTATITFDSGKVVTGTLMSINDFVITVRNKSGATQSFFRDGDNPKVVIVDPLQAHLDLMRKYTDDDMHNLTAYLATLK